MNFGYWHVDTKSYGDFTSGVVFSNLFVNGIYTTSDHDYQPGEPRPWAPFQAAAIRHAGDAGKSMLLNLYMGNSRRVPTPKTVAQAAPYWNRVIGLDLADEPDWTHTEIGEIIAGVRRTVDAKGVPQKPLGVTLEYKTQAFGPQVKWFVEAGIDFFCLEAYVDPPGPLSPAKAVTQLRENVMRQVDRIPAQIKLVLILQAYTRNGAWDSGGYTAKEGLASLEEMQRATFTLADELGDRCMALTAFAYARPSGVLDNPSLKAIHREELGRRNA